MLDLQVCFCLIISVASVPVVTIGNPVINARKDCDVPKPRDCDDILKQGYTTTGVYMIYPLPGLTGFPVTCDMDTDSGGWTVIQRRVSNSDFYKTWNEYQVGFGDLKTNF
jgi:hypothetical protein